MNNTRYPLIVTDPNICFGKPTFKNTRVLVTQVLEQLSAWDSIEEIFKDFPRLTRAHIDQAFAYSAAMINFEEIAMSYA